MFGLLAMKQIVLDFSKGEVMLLEVPTPALRHDSLLIQSKASLISIGTERMLLEFGQSSLAMKAWRQPDRVRQVISKIRTDGLHSTLNAVRSKLTEPIAIGYCNAGVVVGV